MNTNDFDFQLPEKLIAQHPIENRSESKLLLLDKLTGEIKHEVFSNIVKYLKKGDVLVLNNTKVIPARIYGNKETTNAKIEFLILKEIKKDLFEVLVKPARRIKKGDVVVFSQKLKCKCIEVYSDGLMHFEFIYEGILIEILEEIGSMPLPPYIKEKLEDQSRYQTVYAKNNGSAAAPTAGLHFTKELIEEIKSMGVEIANVTLHVGLGTFRPVSVSNVLDHKMHTEEYFITKENALILDTAYREKRRIIAVGTTSTRTLESAFDNGFKECRGETSIFIYPGYQFKAVDIQITNFHLPKSTLMMLVSAFATKEYIMNAYNEAINKEYRFFSFGDSMMIK